jgi:putative lipoprotein
MKPARLAGALAAIAAICFSPPATAAPPDPDPWFSPDKALHFGACGAIAGGAYGISALYVRPVPARVVIGSAAGITVGALKEVLDLQGLGHPSWKDVAWDVFGTAVGIGIAVTIDVATRGPSKPSGRASVASAPAGWLVRF